MSTQSVSGSYNWNQDSRNRDFWGASVNTAMLDPNFNTSVVGRPWTANAWGAGTFDPSVFGFDQIYTPNYTAGSANPYMSGNYDFSNSYNYGGYGNYGNGGMIQRRPNETDDEYQDRIWAWQDKMDAKQAEREEKQRVRLENREVQKRALLAKNNNIEEAATQLYRQVDKDEQIKAKTKIDALIKACEANYRTADGEIPKGMTAAQVHSLALKDAKAAYSKYNNGAVLEEHLETKGSSNFWNGLKRTATFGLCGEDRTAQDNINYINGENERTTSEKFADGAGKVL